MIATRFAVEWVRQAGSGSGRWIRQLYGVLAGVNNVQTLEIEPVQRRLRSRAR